jgi:hypothetical protein
VDILLPTQYPLSAPSDDQIQIKILSQRTFLQCRPAELYLGSSTRNKQLQFGIFWDGNVYADETVRDWFSEIMAAIRHYLLYEQDTAAKL